MAGLSLTLSLSCSKDQCRPLRLVSSKKSPTSAQSVSRMPRSTGCAACKRRKVRCDETQPACQRCLKANLDCPGYIPTPEPTQKKTSFPFKDQTQLTIAKAEGSWTSSRRANYSQASQGEDSTTLAEPVALNLTATSTQLYETFLENYLPQDRSNQQAGYTYLVNLPSTTASNHALRSASQALAFIRLSSKTRDHNLIQHSRVAYVTSLSKLRLALSDPDSANQDETLATIMLLGLYELHRSVREPTVGTINHFLGATRYILLRGPESFKTDQSKILFNSHRNVMVIIGIETHKHILYDRPEWLAVTRSFAEADDWSAVFDIGVHVPAALEATDALVSNPNPASMANAARTVLCQLRHLKGQIAKWQQRVKNRDSECWLVPLKEVPGMSAELTAAAPFEMAFTGRSYNHVLNGLLAIIFQCHVLRAALQVQHYRMIAMSDDEEEGEAAEFQAALEEDYKKQLGLLVQCVPFMQRPESNATGRMVLATAIWLARHASREVGLEAEASWCDAVFEETNRQKMGYVLDDAFDTFPPLRPELD